MQILVAVATSICVLETGRRFLSLRIGLLAAVIATLPALPRVARPAREPRDPRPADRGGDVRPDAARGEPALLGLDGGRGLGVVVGLGVLSNARLTVLPLVLGAFVLWRGAGWAVAIAVPLVALVTVSPWVIRNKVELGCFAITTDGRALWKANNVNTYRTLANGLWLDQVPDMSAAAREADPADVGDAGDRRGRMAQNHVVIDVPDAPPAVGLRASRLPVLDPPPRREGPARRTGDGDALEPAGRNRRRPRERRRQPPEVGRAALHGAPVPARDRRPLLRAELAVRVLAIIFLLYETAAAWVFAGTTRYRVPWDFVLALLAAAAIDRGWTWFRGRRA